MLDADRVARAFESACLAELDAIKPGNVGRHGDGHRMQVADFEASASAASPWIARADASIGQRISDAMEATLSAVAKNTNLGIVLLAAPLAHAAQQPHGSAPLEDRSERSLATLDVEDARLAFAAIAKTAPGGLGRASDHDVRESPTVTLLTAMAAAAAHDRIAFQYAENYVDVYAAETQVLAVGKPTGVDPNWQTTALYLHFLSRFPDTHVRRRQGAAVAERVRIRAEVLVAAVQSHLECDVPLPPNVVRCLLDVDRQWKALGVNPGTSADLTVATLFCHTLRKALSN